MVPTTRELVANSTHQRIDEESPLLSALSHGERIQFLAPATTPHPSRITIRRPSDEVWSIEELSGAGFFRTTRRARMRSMTRKSSFCDCSKPRLRDLHALSGEIAKNIVVLRSYRLRQNDRHLPGSD